MLIPGQSQYVKSNLRRVPEDFVTECNITLRQNRCGTLQLNASDIINNLALFKPKDAYCLLGITNTDIYPQENWDFIFGYTNITAKIGVFSFARYDPEFYNRD